MKAKEGLALESVRRISTAAAWAVAVWCLLALFAGCASSAGSASEESDVVADVADVANTATDAPKTERLKLFVPLSWDANSAYLVTRQGTAGLWGACGECAIANTLNIVTGSAYTEADIVGYVVDRDLCDPESGGMSVDHMLAAYKGLLPLDSMDVTAIGWTHAPDIDAMAALIERGIILDVSVYGEMMREGGHTGEGEIYGTHWIVVHSVERANDGSVAGFGIVDSASSTTYLTAQALSDIYFGHDGTTVVDPICVLVYGWTDPQPTR